MVVDWFELAIIRGFGHVMGFVLNYFDAVVVKLECLLHVFGASLSFIGAKSGFASNLRKYCT